MAGEEHAVSESTDRSPYHPDPEERLPGRSKGRYASAASRGRHLVFWLPAADSTSANPGCPGAHALQGLAFRLAGKVVRSTACRASRAWRARRRAPVSRGEAVRTAAADVVGRALRRQALEEPQSRLAVRERVILSGSCGDDRDVLVPGNRAAPSGREISGEGFESEALEQIRQRDPQAGARRNFLLERRCRQGIEPLGREWLPGIEAGPGIESTRAAWACRRS